MNVFAIWVDAIFLLDWDLILVLEKWFFIPDQLILWSGMDLGLLTRSLLRRCLCSCKISVVQRSAKRRL